MINVKKGILLLVGLIVISFGVNWLMHRMHAYEKMREPAPRARDGGYDDDDVDGLIEGLWLPPEWMFSISELMQGILGVVTSGMGIFYQILIYTTVIASLSDLGKGIFQHFVCGGDWFAQGFANGIQSAAIIAGCMAEKVGGIVNGDCLRFYVVDIIFGLIYFIGSAVLSIIWTITGVDLKPIITMGWNLTVEPLDAIIFSVTGHHITKWSESTIYRCYRCEADFAPNGGNEIKRIKDMTIVGWGKVLGCSIDSMKEGIYKMVTSVIPSRKWGAWAQGEHQDGSDDDPPFTF